MNTPIDEQTRIKNVLAGVDALKKMEQILDANEDYFGGLDEAMALIKATAGEMSPTAEGVFTVLAEYFCFTLMDGGIPSLGHSYYAVTHEEMLAFRQEMDAQIERDSAPEIREIEVAQ